MKLPTEAQARKDVPIATGVVDYFPLALASIAELSRLGNEQHNPGTPLHWDRSKSGDEGDALMRHFVERGTFDADGLRHSTKVAWRALALLQKEIEASNLKCYQECAGSTVAAPSNDTFRTRWIYKDSYGNEAESLGYYTEVAARKAFTRLLRRAY